jgi:hypothetical protein
LGFAWAAIATSARADIISWDIDPVESFVQLTVPDQAVTVGTTNATIRLRDNDSTTVWTPAGGRSAFVDGTIQTDYFDGVSIRFLSGTHDMFALEQANVRPNPAQFTGDPNEDNPDGVYEGTGAALAAYGARVRATAIITLDVAYLAIRDVEYNISSGVIPLGGGTTIGGSSSNFGISSASADVDGLNTLIGQVIPDVRDGALLPIIGLEEAAGVVDDLGGGLRRLTYNVDVDVTINLEGTILTGTASGKIVAYATVVPEPGSLGLAGMGLMALVGRRIRRRVAA